MLKTDDKSGYQHADEDMDDLPGPEHPSRDCKKSIFMNSAQDMPEDAASTQAQLAGVVQCLAWEPWGRG